MGVFLEISKIYTQSYNQSLMKRKFGVNVYGFIPTMPRLIINNNNESTNRNAFYFKTLKLISKKSTFDLKYTNSIDNF